MNNDTEHVPFFFFTDFGADSIYTGQMRGVVKSFCPNADLMTLTNTVPRQNTVAAAFLLSTSVDYLPDGSHVLCVVDPGVGSDRPIVCLRTASGLTLLGPDNGMFSVLEDRIRRCHKVTAEALWLDDVSNTFHGRDIMAPTLAHLANGTSLESVGPSCESLKSLEEEERFSTEERDGTISGYVLYADVFGNLITGISGEQLKRTGGDDVNRTARVTCGDHEIRGIASSYDEKPPGEPLAIISSANHLELAVNRGSAVDELNVSPGDPVRVDVSQGTN